MEFAFKMNCSPNKTASLLARAESSAKLKKKSAIHLKVCAISRTTLSGEPMQNYFLDASRSNSWDTIRISHQVYTLVCRADFLQPGFALIKMAQDETSIGMRKKIVELKEGLSGELRAKRNYSLAWFNLTRFDQKNTTKPHRDGAPRESLLILGYEPTLVDSRITISDYSKCASALGITPDAFLESFNPMYEKGLELLEPYTVHLEEFDKSAFQILVLNNSDTEFCPERRLWQGVLHSATVDDSHLPRVINSTCVFPQNDSESGLDPNWQTRQDEFLNSNTSLNYS